MGGTMAIAATTTAGWSASASITTTVVVGWRTQAAGGGIWAPGGIVSDGLSLFAATGNTFETSQWRGGEAIIRLGFDLKPLQSARDYFVPSDWRMLDRRDADLGGTSPLPIRLNGSGTVRQFLI